VIYCSNIFVKANSFETAQMNSPSQK